DPRSAGHDPARAGGFAAAPAPFPRVPDRDLVVRYAVVPGGTRDVQVAVHNGGGPVPDMPVTGQPGAAPLREDRVPQDACRVLDEREVVDQNSVRRWIE